jgi:hypothetical protein
VERHAADEALADEAEQIRAAVGVALAVVLARILLRQVL